MTRYCHYCKQPLYLVEKAIALWKVDGAERYHWKCYEQVSDLADEGYALLSLSQTHAGPPGKDLS